MPKLLLHVCCGPCSLVPVAHFGGEGWDITAFFFNPNIQPAEEWLLRCGAMRQVARALNIALVEEGHSADPAAWAISLGGARERAERCPRCYGLRLDRTAQRAAEQGFDAFSTSLLYSRYQQHENVRRMAEDAARRHGASFLYRDFRPWWWDGVARAQKMGIYRQKWCGCLLSQGEALAQQEEAARRKAEQKKVRAERLSVEAEERQLRRQRLAGKRALRAKARSLARNTAKA